MASNNNFGRTKTSGESTRISLRNRIIGLCRVGKSVTQICEELRCTRQTAWRWIDRYKEEGEVTTRPKTGAPRKTTPEQDRSLIQRTLANPNMTVIESVKTAELYHVSLTTIRKRLLEAGLHPRITDSKEDLTAQNIKDELAFSDAHEYQEEGNLSPRPTPGLPWGKTASPNCLLLQRTVENSEMTATDNATAQVSQDDERGGSKFPLDDSTVEDKQLEIVLVKEEKEEDGLEEGVEHCQNETFIKQEPLPWNEPESAEDVKAISGADAGSSGSSSASAEILKAHPPVLGEDRGPLLICGDVISNYANTRLSNRNKPFVCQQCPYRTDEKRYLVRHLLKHSERNESLVCVFCAHLADSKDDLSKHLLSHESIRYKPLACSQCEYRTYGKSHLRKHLLVHESVRDKPHACSQCQYRTDYKCNLKKHLLKHKNVRNKPFSCTKCEYRTDDRGNLRKHLATHDCARDKPFVCSICEYRTDRKGSLAKHLTIHDS